MYRGREGRVRGANEGKLITSPAPLQNFTSDLLLASREKEEEARGRMTDWRKRETYWEVGHFRIFLLLLKICSISRYKTLRKTGGCIRGFKGEVGQKAEGLKKKATEELLNCNVG